MTQHSPSPQLAIDPLEHFKDEWILTRKEFNTKGLTVNHVIADPDDSDTPSYNKHLLCFQFNPGTRQVTRIGNKEYDGPTKSGSVFLLPAYTPAFWHFETTDEALIFTIEPSLLHRVALENDHPKADYLELRNILYTQDPKLARFAADFLHEMQTEGFGGKIYLESISNLFLIHLLRQYCTVEGKFKRYEGGLSKYKLDKVLAYIHTYQSSDISLEAIAQQAGLSKYYFSQMFKQSIGVSPYQYVLQLRVEKAKTLLKQTQMSITDIALECGFANQSHLSRHFRMRMGVSPKMYRNQL
ncbi:MAG: AraC family transcriptional regulator [Leptolyngbyaceae cyanobacterium MO_188.B28]|nr:AraC family transcriptional regulator [Leptolyngbyaceae cyanobacterium MO_188.B28]